MSIAATAYTRAGFNTPMSSPGLSGIYFGSVALYNPVVPLLTVQNGVAQNTLPAQTAQLYQVPTTGSPLTAQNLLPSTAPYGSWTGPLTAVWFDPTESPGSYPVTLGAVAGLLEFTPVITLSSTAVYVVPNAPFSSITITQASGVGDTVTVTGYQTSSVLGSGVVASNGTVSITLSPGTADTILEVTSSATQTAVVSVFLGLRPTTASGGL